jgi:2-dehydropantoate 2-reductase
MIDWHILGAGAIGGLWACYLHKAGHRVELLFKNSTALDHYHDTGGLTLIGSTGSEKMELPAGVAGQPGSPITHLLITTKAHQTLEALETCVPRWSDQCRLLLLQNGMGVAEQITGRFPAIPLYCGVTTDGAYCPVPFNIVLAGTGWTDIGAMHVDDKPHALIEQLPFDYLDIRACEDIKARQWQKLAINCAVNGLTVMFHCRNGALLENADALTRIARLCDEIEQVGTAAGYGSQVDDLYQKTIAVLQATAGNYSSMYQDIAHRRRTEIDYLNGYLLKQATRLGIACPENAQLYSAIRQQEAALNCSV